MMIDRSFRTASVLSVFFSVLLCASNGFSQFQFQSEDESDAAQSVYGPKLGASESQIWRAGIEIQPGAEMDNVVVSIPIPMDWPEQKVLGISEAKTDAALSSKIEYKIVNGGCREMTLRLGKMRPHRKVEIIVEVDLLNYELLPPDRPDEHYVIPKRIPTRLQQYVRESPKIECSDSRFKKIFNTITKDKGSDWEKVEAIYRYVQDNVKYNEAGRDKIAKGALELTRMKEGEWEGDCKDMSCLFVAICRAGKIPARLVRVPEHCYAEFYLVLKEGLEENKVPEKGSGKRKQDAPTGFWFPCQVAGTYSFGGIPERQPILQKGDSYPDPDHRPRGKKMFLTECFEGSLVQGSPQPKFQWVRGVKGK